MDWSCPVCFRVFKRTGQAHRCYSGGSADNGFRGSGAQWLPLYLELLTAVQAKVPFSCEYPPSGGAQWRRRSNFASMHGERAGLYVNFFSDQRLQGLELLAVTVISARRLLHVVCLTDAGRVGEIADYLVASYYLTEQDHT